MNIKFKPKLALNRACELTEGKGLNNITVDNVHGSKHKTQSVQAMKQIQEKMHHAPKM